MMMMSKAMARTGSARAAHSRTVGELHARFEISLDVSLALAGGALAKCELCQNPNGVAQIQGGGHGPGANGPALPAAPAPAVAAVVAPAPVVDTGKAARCAQAKAFFAKQKEATATPLPSVAAPAELSPEQNERPTKKLCLGVAAPAPASPTYWTATGKVLSISDNGLTVSCSAPCPMQMAICGSEMIVGKEYFEVQIEKLGGKANFMIGAITSPWDPTKPWSLEKDSSNLFFINRQGCLVGGDCGGGSGDSDWDYSTKQLSVDDRIGVLCDFSRNSTDFYLNGKLLRLGTTKAHGAKGPLLRAVAFCNGTSITFLPNAAMPEEAPGPRAGSANEESCKQQ